MRGFVRPIAQRTTVIRAALILTAGLGVADLAAQEVEPAHPFRVYVTRDSAQFTVPVPAAVWQRAAVVRGDSDYPRGALVGDTFEWSLLWDQPGTRETWIWSSGLTFRLPIPARGDLSPARLPAQAGRASQLGLQDGGLQVIEEGDIPVQARWAPGALVLRVGTSPVLNELLAWRPDTVALRALLWAADTTYTLLARPEYISK